MKQTNSLLHQINQVNKTRFAIKRKLDGEYRILREVIAPDTRCVCKDKNLYIVTDKIDRLLRDNTLHSTVAFAVDDLYEI